MDAVGLAQYVGQRHLRDGDEGMNHLLGNLTSGETGS